MEINITEDKNGLIIELFGEFTIANIKLFQDKIFPLFNTNKEVFILNMEHIRFIDSSGIGKLVQSLDILKNKGKLFFLTNVPPNVLNNFKTVRLDNFFKILPLEEIKKKYIK